MVCGGNLLEGPMFEVSGSIQFGKMSFTFDMDHVNLLVTLLVKSSVVYYQMFSSITF